MEDVGKTKGYGMEEGTADSFRRVLKSIGLEEKTEILSGSIRRGGTICHAE